MALLSLDRRSIILGAALTAPAVALAARSLLQRPRLSLLDLLSPAERSDVLGGVNRLDITPKLARLLSEAPDGAVVDASMLTGSVTLSADPFARLPSRAVTLLTGRVTLRKDFNQGMVALPSRFTWQCDGTELRPLGTIRQIPSDASPGVGLLSTRVMPGICSGTAGDDRVTLERPVYALGLEVGARMAIFGIQEDPGIRHRIDRPLTPSSPSFGFDAPVSGTIEGSLVYLRIDDEIVLGEVRQGRLTVGPRDRGALGTRAAAHAGGATATLLRSAIFRIVSVAGTTVRLDRALPRGFALSPFRAGSVGTAIQGKLAIDGEFVRGRPSGYFSCLATTLSEGFVANGGIRLRRGMHGGFMGFGCAHADVTLDEVSGCGRPADRLGGSIWLFGSAEANRVHALRVTDGNAGLLIDNKSNGMSYYGLDGPCDDNSVDIDRLDAHEVAGQISGSSGNVVHFGSAETRSASFIIDEGRSQATAPVAARDNDVTLRQAVRRPTGGDALGQNRIHF